MSGDSVRQRARNLADELEAEIIVFNTVAPQLSDAAADKIVAFIESESALARREERLECAKAICDECRKGDVPERYVNKDLGIHAWIHTMLGFDDRTEDCAAAAIHDRADREETK